MIKTILFDFDGVLADNYELNYELSAKKTKGLTREEHRQLFEGNIHTTRELLKSRDTGFDIKKHFSDAKKDMVISPKVKEVLTTLSKKYTLGIITSAKEYGVFDCLSKNNLSELFSFVYGYETGELKVDKFKKVFATFNVSSEECIFITDTLGDILEANQVSMKTIAIDSGYHERERLEKGNPYKIISSLNELHTLVDNL